MVTIRDASYICQLILVTANILAYISFFLKPYKETTKLLHMCTTTLDLFLLLPWKPSIVAKTFSLPALFSCITCEDQFINTNVIAIQLSPIWLGNIMYLYLQHNHTKQTQNKIVKKDHLKCAMKSVLNFYCILACCPIEMMEENVRPQVRYLPSYSQSNSFYVLFLELVKMNKYKVLISK